MSKSFAAPRNIRRIAARRVFQSAKGKRVVLTIGVSDRIPGSDWVCALQITGLNTNWRGPQYVFGIDGLQALHLAMKCSAAVLESAEPDLVWRFLPYLPKPHRHRLEAIVEREATKFWRRVNRTHKPKISKRSKGPKRTKGADTT